MSAPRYAVIVYRITLVFTLLAVLGGAIVCATESGFECGNWPGCTDDAILPGGAVNELLYRNPWIEMTHRISAFGTGPFAVAAAIIGLRLKGVHPVVKIGPWVTIAGAIVAGYVGRGIVLGEVYPTWVSAADLGSALLALIAITTATVALERTPATWAPSRTGLLAWAGLAVVWIFHLVSFWAAGPMSYTRCMSWPVWMLVHADANASIGAQYARFVVAVAAAALIVAAAVGALRRGERMLAWLVLALLAAVLGFGLTILLTGTDAVGVLFSTATVALFFCLGLLAARLSFIARRTAASVARSEEFAAA
ncbi:MAG TPA: hypothetical protein K8V15_09435 [Tessaracoccus flavescens]|uniref:Cytochrome oxidase assembly protein n=1 Tax=Tessaracoccus flavescens TaxID=399497 RepID=A0A921JRA7_9ACTN|nr:hypothetical protein [Tessaracoccus flavescens]